MRASILLSALLCLPAFGEYAEIHGIKMYYEIHGEGRPVVLLHGGTSSIQLSFAAQLPVLARSHRVIAIEQMGHGHTGDVAGRELSYEGMTEDTAALLVQLGIANADVVGWSDGGQLALRLAFTHPELVRRVVASGVGLGAMTPQAQQAIRSLSPDRWSAEAREEYGRVSPDGAQHWPVFFDKRSADHVGQAELGFFRAGSGKDQSHGDDRRRRRGFYARRGDYPDFIAWIPLLRQDWRSCRGPTTSHFRSGRNG